MKHLTCHFRKKLGSSPIDKGNLLYKRMSANKSRRTDRKSPFYNLQWDNWFRQELSLNVKLLKKEEKKDQSTIVSTLYPSLALRTLPICLSAPTILLKLQCLKNNGDFSIAKYDGLFSSTMISLWNLTLKTTSLSLNSFFVYKRLVICFGIMNQANIKWLKNNNNLLLFLMVLWVDWA